MDSDRQVDLAFGARMAEYRRRRGLSQAELSAALEREGVRIDVPGISRIENGSRAASLTVAMRIAAALNMTLDSLIPKDEAQRALDLDGVARDLLVEGFNKVVEGTAKAIQVRRLLIDSEDAASRFGAGTSRGAASEALRRVHGDAADQPLRDPSEYLSWLTKTLEKDQRGILLDGADAASDTELLEFIANTARLFFLNDWRKRVSDHDERQAEA